MVLTVHTCQEHVLKISVDNLVTVSKQQFFCQKNCPEKLLEKTCGVVYTAFLKLENKELMPIYPLLMVLLAANLFIAGPLTAQPTATAESLRRTAIDFRQVAKEAIPAVVSIRVKVSSDNAAFNEDNDEDNQCGEDFWQRFFGLPKGYRGQGQKKQQDDVIGQ